jgi:hypothetical protein
MKLSEKKSATAFGAGNGFFGSGVFFWVCSGHYQPLVIIADDDPGDNDENKANKVDDGDVPVHRSMSELVSVITLTGIVRHVKQFSRSCEPALLARSGWAYSI